MKERISYVPGSEDNEQQAPILPIDINDQALLESLLNMPRPELRKLIERVLLAGWGYGKLKGNELIKHALMGKDDAYEALKITALTLATNATEWREFVALATFWAEREKGKPQQSLDVTTTHTRGDYKMLTSFTMKETFYTTQHVLHVDTESKYAEYYTKENSIMRPIQLVDYNDVSTVEKAEAFLKKSPSKDYATRIEYLHAFRHAA